MSKHGPMNEGKLASILRCLFHDGLPLLTYPWNERTEQNQDRGSNQHRGNRTVKENTEIASGMEQ